MNDTLFTDLTIGAFFEEEVRQHPDRDFVVYPDRGLRWSYRDFDQRVNLLAKGLIEIGIDKGDHVGIWARNVPDWLTFMFATAKIGAVLVTINTLYKAHEVGYVIKQSDMKALALIDRFKDVDYLRVIREVIPELSTCARGKLQCASYPELKSVIYIGQEKHRGMFNTNELMLLGAQLDDEPLRDRIGRCKADDAVNMQYTSGTTGFPKGAMLTHRNILNNGYFIGERQKFTGQDRVCLPVPLFHCFGITLGILAILTHGATVVMVEIFDPLQVLTAIQKERCTAVYGVPTMFIAELNHPRFSEFDLSTLRTGIMAGSPCPMQVMRQVMERMHCSEITIAYGLTEGSPVFVQTSTDDPIERRVSTVGTGMPHIEIKIVDPATGLEVGPNTPGEICCRGYNVMKGYYKMPEETRSTIDQEGWLHSGDLAVVDEQGYYRITGRIKDMIIRGGENIYPREIEEFLHTMPGISDVQVVGVPDERYGETVGAFIIPSGNPVISEETVKSFCKDRIARYKIPKHIFFVENYPMTASGKIQKFRLRELAAESAAAQA